VDQEELHLQALLSSHDDSSHQSGGGDESSSDEAVSEDGSTSDKSDKPEQDEAKAKLKAHINPSHGPSNDRVSQLHRFERPRFMLHPSPQRIVHNIV
jgi:hypothetical protein